MPPKVCIITGYNWSFFYLQKVTFDLSIKIIMYIMGIYRNDLIFRPLHIPINPLLIVLIAYVTTFVDLYILELSLLISNPEYDQKSIKHITILSLYVELNHQHETQDFGCEHTGDSSSNRELLFVILTLVGSKQHINPIASA